MPINSTFILVMLVIAGYVYCYFAITSRNNTILELNGKIAEQQLIIEQATITKQKQQEIILSSRFKHQKKQPVKPSKLLKNK